MTLSPSPDPAAPAPDKSGGLYRSAELRVVLAAAVAAGAMLLAVLAVVAGRTDLLLLDFREWRPVNAGAESFNRLQAVPAERRPFRLTLQLDPGRARQDSLAAEREFPAAEGGRYCFRVLASAPAPAAGIAEDARVAVYVNDAVAWSAPLADVVKGCAISVAGIRSRGGRIKVRLELRSAQRTAAPPLPASAVHFEYATLRRCPR
jgi:hypothetical protein